MGSCVSVHKESKTDMITIPEPIKVKPIVNGTDRLIAEGGLKSQWSPTHPVTTVRDLGSREKTFFDSQLWLESDCEDDFFSVNGDFTPSRGSTPIHQSFSARVPQFNKALFDNKTPGFKPEPSPTRRKKLAELFRDSSTNRDIDEQNISGNQNGVNEKVDDVATNIIGLSPRPSNGTTPFVSGANSMLDSETTPNGHYSPEKEKHPIKSVQCCLPRMLSPRSYRERRKKTNLTRTIYL